MCVCLSACVCVCVCDCADCRQEMNFNDCPTKTLAMACCAAKKTLHIKLFTCWLCPLSPKWPITITNTHIRIYINVHMSTLKNSNRNSIADAPNCSGAAVARGYASAISMCNACPLLLLTFLTHTLCSLLLSLPPSLCLPLQLLAICQESADIFSLAN